MSQTVIGVKAFGCFCQGAQQSDWSGLCSEGTGSRPREPGVKGEVSSWKCWDRDRKRTRTCLPHGTPGSWEITVTEETQKPSIRKCIYFCSYFNLASFILTLKSAQ